MDPSAYALHAQVEEHHWWFRARRRVVSRVLSQLGLPTPARVLEFGAGTGGNAAMLSHFGAVCAIEPDEAARSFASQKAPFAEHLASLSALGHERRFDVALLLDVAEHLEDPVAQLRCITAHLEPGAPLVLTVPAHPLLYGAHDAYLHHERRYTASLLREQLREAALSVEALSPLNAVSLLPAAVARAIEAGRALLGHGQDHAPRGMELPPTLLNRALEECFALERHVLPWTRVPFGLSLLAVARTRSAG